MAQMIVINNARDEKMRSADLHRVAELSRATGHMATKVLVKHETVGFFSESDSTIPRRVCPPARAGTDKSIEISCSSARRLPRWQFSSAQANIHTLSARTPRRYQRVMVLVTAVMAMLCIEIWLYYSKAEARTHAKCFV